MKPYTGPAYKMDPEDKAVWLHALRSGEYEQGRGTLCNATHYCCLGVYAEVKGMFGGKYPNGLKYIGSSGGLGGTTSTLPDHVLPRKVQTYLIGLNDGTSQDSRSYSFAEIADWIEENL